MVILDDHDLTRKGVAFTLFKKHKLFFKIVIYLMIASMLLSTFVFAMQFI